MFYLNRGGAPEGPYEEARIVQMILAGELTQAGVCPVGQNQWWSLQQFPAFAQALAQRAAAPAGYGAPPAGYAPPARPYGQPPPAGYGPGPGPTAPGYGAHAHAPASPTAPGARKTLPEEKKGGRTLLIVGLASMLLLFLIGSAVGAYLLFFAGGSPIKIASAMPRDSELMLELGSLPQLVADFKDVEYLDTSLRDDKRVFDDTADSIAKAFDISLDDARAFILASRSAGFAARKLAGSLEGALVIGFSSKGAVEGLLKSPRFIASGALGQTGKRYQLTRKVLQSSVGQDVLLKSLADSELGTGKELLVWFPDHKLLTLGSEVFLTDLAKVLEQGAASIESNPSFQAATKDFDAKARLTAFLDPTVLANIEDPKLKELVDGYFKPAGPMTGSLSVKPAGFITSFTGRIIGSKLPKGSAYAPPTKLELPARLPVETFAYLAVQTQTKLSGAELQKQLLEQLQAADPRSKREAEQGLQQLEQLLGVSVATLIDGLGSEAVLALGASPELALDAALLGDGTQAASKLSVTWAQQLKDETEYKRLAAQLKTKVLSKMREVILTEDGPGFSLAPRGAPLAVGLRVKFFDKHLFISAGGNALCDRAEAAFSKSDRALKDDAAHQAALAALPDTQHFRLWVDTGRIAETLFRNPLLRARATEAGVQLEKFRLGGPQRVTSALSVRSEVQNEVWTYRIDALNLQALAPLGIGAAALGGGLPGRPAALPPL
ncbi:MAG TPA: hypothetical protein VIW29_04695 [Polyangiaceae bacterium]